MDNFDNYNSSLNKNRLLRHSQIEKILVAEIYYDKDPKSESLKKDNGTGFFIKLKKDGKITPYFCTAKHVIKKERKIIPLILNKKDKNDKYIKISLIYDEKEKDIIKCDYDIIFIEVINEEIKNIPIEFFEFKEMNVYNPIKYIDSEVIMIGYPVKYLKDGAEISFGRIVKIKDEYKIVYNMQADMGSSGSPVCINNDKNELELIGIHTEKNLEEKLNYFEGILLGPIIKKIFNYDFIEVHDENNIDWIKNLIKNVSDNFDNAINKEKKEKIKEMEDNDTYDKLYYYKLKYFPKPKIYYEDILFYDEFIKEERKKLNKERFFIFYEILEKHLLNEAYELFGEENNEINLNILRNFFDTNSIYNEIRSSNHDIINIFNTILLSEDYILKSKIIYFIAAYIDTLDKMNCRYNYTNINLYYRSLMDVILLENIIENKKKDISFKFFLDGVIPNTIFYSLYKRYYDSKAYFNYEKIIKYDTRIYIEVKNENLNIPINCFKISFWPELVIAPFTIFEVKEDSEINYDEGTADIHLVLKTLKSKDDIKEKTIEVFPELI